MHCVAMVTLLTDFGLADATVGSMKAQILASVPMVCIVDLSHAVPAQDVRAGAFLLERVAPDCPRGTIHLAVVDPGVGSARRAVAARDAEGSWFVGPDNGLLGRAVGDCAQCIELDATRVGSIAARTPAARVRASSTFHGRDLFAPAVAHLARGGDPLELGVEGAPPRVLPSSASREAHRIEGEVMWIDHFGNALTEIEAAWLPAVGTPIELRCGTLTLERVVRTYADVEPREPLAYVGSAGTLELGLRDGHLARTSGLERGMSVSITWPPAPTRPHETT